MTAAHVATIVVDTGTLAWPTPSVTTSDRPHVSALVMPAVSMLALPLGPAVMVGATALKLRARAGAGQASVHA